MRNPGHDSRDLNGVINAATADCADVIEFGCMFGDRLAACEAPQREGVDAHAPYIEEARRKYPAETFIHADARDFARYLATASRHKDGSNCRNVRYDAVLLCDFIEHLRLNDAIDIVRASQRIACRRVIAFVPLGPHPQTRDVFGMGADHWQTHRSTWEPADLAALGFDVAVWDGYHAQPGKDSRAAFAIWEPGV